MLENNQFGVKPGPYEHYKGGIYILRNIVTHHKLDGAWTHIQDPWIVYEHLEPKYEEVNGVMQQVQKSYMRRMSEFTAEVEVDGQKVKRFKPL